MNLSYRLLVLLVLITGYCLPATYADMALPQWHLNDWWDIDQVVEIEVTQIFPGSSMTTTDHTRYTIIEIGSRTQTQTGKSYDVYVMDFEGELQIDGIIYLLGLPKHVRVVEGTMRGEQWNRVSDMSVAMTYRQLAGFAEAESDVAPGQWEPLGPLTINLYEEYDLPIPYGYPLIVGQSFDYTLTNHMFGDFTLNTAFGDFTDDFYDTSVWTLNCAVRSLQTNECQQSESSYYIYANHYQDGIPAIQEGWVEPSVKWYNKVELTRFAHPLGLVRRASLCLTAADVYQEQPVELDLSLVLNQNLFHAEDRFYLAATVSNDSAAQAADLYVVLDLSSLGIPDPYYFYPEWINIAQGLDYQALAFSPGTTALDILDFAWPTGAGAAANLYFWAALMEPGSTSVIGDVESVMFGFE